MRKIGKMVFASAAAVLLLTGQMTAYADGYAPLNADDGGQRYVRLSGEPVGITIQTDGVVIAEVTEVVTDGGCVRPAQAAGLEAGDIIVRANGAQLASAAELSEKVKASDGKRITLEVTKPSGRRTTVELTPAMSSADGCFRAGIWVRDSTAGIGMLTFVDEKTGAFGAVGHSISDDGTGVPLPVGGGEMDSVVLTAVSRGASGSPGELIGYLGGSQLGKVTLNCASGVFGGFDGVCTGQLYPVADRQDVAEGAAQMLTTLPGSGTQLYNVEVVKINYDEKLPARNMVIRVTDGRLLKASGGIVQGMSGSPLIQNGRFIGAVTHVFVNDPTKGYAVFADSMVAAGDRTSGQTDAAQSAA